MTQSEPTSEGRQRGAASWWTPGRVRLAGLGAVVAGLVGIAVLVIGTGRPGPVGSTDVGMLGVVYPLGFALFVVALLAANARYGPQYGRGGRAVTVVFTQSLAGYAGTTLLLTAGRDFLGGSIIPLGILTGGAYMLTRLAGTIYGAALFGWTDANKVTAVLFAVLFPAVFVLGPLTLVGFPAPLIEAPIFLAFIALGVGLWRNSAVPAKQRES